MNRLPFDKRVQIVSLLVEGMSLRAVSRVADASINTVTKLLVDVGEACQRFHDEHVRALHSKRVQCDEIWAFVYAKKKQADRDHLTGIDGAGDIWTWVGIDADSKLVISWLVGARSAVYADAFMRDVAERIDGRVQMTTDGLNAYLEAVEGAFGADIDYAQLVKLFGETTDPEHRYSPATCKGTEKTVVTGNPKPRDISTSYVERQNLTMRMQMRRFTRLTNGFSKKVANHNYAVALHFTYYNFVRIHKTLRVTPAMEAGLTNRLWAIEDLVHLAD
jgi:IS1 family transposase